MSFIAGIVAVGSSVYQATQGNPNNVPLEQYYPAVKAGQLLCPGPYDIATVAAALDRNPAFVAEFDRIIATDAAWVQGGNHYFGPITTNLQRAGIVVNWAHGGRDCQPIAAETAIGDTIRQLLAADAAKQPTIQAQADRVTETLAAQGVSPLQVGLAGLSLFLLLKGR